ncbi:hypothetical protein [Kocuria palustris]|uniref:hypothetical protein n=1 Tax=Kocuria palustris TaxID=71999 RepID=UPI0006AA0A47|nr:hypothetical protein [Kocuria palustris]ALB02532.1 hypothetical protein KPaMU14_01685 [Kocuria palustris]
MSTTMTTNTTPLNEADARELTDQIAEGLADVHSLIVQAWEGRVWEALGFETWDAWIDANFRGLQLRPPREQREEVVLSMREAGMSMRAISQATDLSYGTVNRSARSGDPNGSPERDSNVVGLDGKSYKRPAPTAEDAAEFADVSLDGPGIPMVDPTSLPGADADQVLSGDVLDPEAASGQESTPTESAWWEEPRQALLEAESRCAALLKQRKAEPRLTEDPQDPGPSQLTMAAARTVLAAGGVIVDLGVEDLDGESQEALRKVLSTVMTSLDGVIGDLEEAEDDS